MEHYARLAAAAALVLGCFLVVRPFLGAMLFAVAVYDGYFGAGSGILMLALLGFLGLSDIHTANGLKGFFVTVINVVASAYFIARGAVH